MREAQQAASRLGADANYMWTAFGPTNVAIHQVNTAMELGDVQIALDIGPSLDTYGLPTERRVRHALDVARAYSARNRRDEGLAMSWTPSGWHLNRCAITTSAASWC